MTVETVYSGDIQIFGSSQIEKMQQNLLAGPKKSEFSDQDDFKKCYHCKEKEFRFSWSAVFH